MNAPRKPDTSTAGDRAVAIASILAVLLVAFFGGAPAPVPSPGAVQTAHR
ncbi:MAG: hypothetical protein ACREVS_08515 [Burkholderiales bacterium]